MANIPEKKKAELIGLRASAEGQGSNVGWDAKSGNVTVGDKQYTSQQLQSMGGQMVNDSWQLPQNAIQSMLGSGAKQTPQFNQQDQMKNMMQSNQQMGDAQFKQQKAQLDMMLESQITQLKMAYDQAITDGQISVRDAEAQFEEQKGAIEQQAYLDAERTGLYSQDMGIQNSQQAIGLMQGDQARNNSLINQNMTTRDKRVSDIKDRLNNVRKEKNLALVQAQAEHGYGILGAKADANKMVAQNAFGLMQDDYSANRGQQFAKDNMYLGDELQRGQMELGQEYAKDNMETQFQNALKSATHDSELAIKRMTMQQGFDLEKMSQSLKDDITKMAKQFGYSSALETQSSKNAISQIQAKYELEVKAEENAYAKKLERDLRGVKKGTKEYEVITKNNERDLQNIVLQKHVLAVSDANDIMLATDITTPVEKPKDLSTPDQWGNIGGLLNSVTGYNKKSSKYNAYQSAVERKKASLEDIKMYMPWMQ